MVFRSHFPFILPSHGCAPMENIFPLQERVEIEEIHGSKRPNAYPPSRPKTFNMWDGQESSDCYYSKRLEWFRTGEIHQIERIGMEEVLRRVGEERYRETRDRIVDEYERGRRPMSVKAALGLTDIDLQSLLQIFSFVERWGLINHRSVLSEGIKYLESYKGGEECSGTPSPTEEKDGRSPLDLKGHLEGSTCSCGERAGFFTRSLVFRCGDCFNNGSYPPDVTQSDFFPISSSLARNLWSKKEEFLLLEGINRFGDQWSLVSQHVETKTKDQCALHFLKMPILENALGRADLSVGSPFETAENPVMCLVAFVCGVVHPAVGSECARTAMRYIGSHSQDFVMRSMMETGQERAAEQMEIERRKIQRLEGVMCEARMNRIRLKVESYKDMYLSVDKTHEELVGLKRSLVEELLNFTEESVEES